MLQVSLLPTISSNLFSGVVDMSKHIFANCIMIAFLRHGNGSNVGLFAISSDSCDELFSSLNMCVPFLPYLWTTKRAHGSHEFEYTVDGGQYRVTGEAPAVFHMRQPVLYILKC